MRALFRGAVVSVVAVAAVTASACVLCPDEQLFAVDAPDRAHRASVSTGGCGQESAVSIVLIEARTGGRTQLVSSRYLSTAKVTWSSASTLQVTLVGVPAGTAAEIIAPAVRRVGAVAIEYYPQPAGVAGSR
jgi:hypothetical protein